MSRYLIIEVTPQAITALEYKCEQPDDEIKYIEPFNTWHEALAKLTTWLDGYMWVTVRFRDQPPAP